MSYGGGGFVSGSQGGGSQGGSPGTKRITNLRPVTIHQIHAAEHSHAEADFIIDGQPTKDVTFVACIRTIQKTTSNTSYVLEDGTGTIDARVWSGGQSNDDDEDNGEEGGRAKQVLEQGMYVRVVGSLKSFSGKRNVHANRVRKVEDSNEIMFHGIEAVYVHLYNLRGGPPDSAPGPARPAHNNAATSNNPYTTTTNQSTAFSDLPPVQKEIMDYVALLTATEAVPNEGIHVGSASRELKLSLEIVSREVEKLIDEGHLYHSIDDDHFLSTA